MALQVAYKNFDLFLEGNVENSPNPGDPATGRLGFEEWLQNNVTTLHDIEYNENQNIQVIIYE